MTPEVVLKGTLQNEIQRWITQWTAADDVKFLAPADFLHKVRAEKGRNAIKEGKEALTEPNSMASSGMILLSPLPISRNRRQ